MSVIRPEEIPIRPDGLQLDEKRPFQQAFWRLQRVLWLAYVGLLIVALAGLTGRGGPLAVQTAAGEQGAADLPRIARRGATDEVSVTFTRTAADHRLVLDQEFLSHFQIDSIAPRPVAEASLPEGALLLFAASGAPPHRVTLHVRVQHAGMAIPVLELDGTRPSFRTLILP